MTTRTDGRVAHNFQIIGFDNLECVKCGVDAYATRTKFCDEVADEHAWEATRHDRRDAVLEKLRGVLNKEEWATVELNRFAAHRVIDKIII